MFVGDISRRVVIDTWLRDYRPAQHSSRERERGVGMTESLHGVKITLVLYSIIQSLRSYNIISDSSVTKGGRERGRGTQ